MLIKRKNKNIIVAIVISIIAIFIPSLLLNKHIEGIIFFFNYWIIRSQFPQKYNLSSFAIYKFLASLTLFLGVTFIAPLEYSFISVIPICYFTNWVGHTKNKADNYESKYDKITQFDCETCTEEQLLERCRLKRLNSETTELAKELFIKKLTRKELSIKYYIEEDSIKKKKQRLKKKLNEEIE